MSRMTEAAVQVVDCIRELHDVGSNLVVEALRGGAQFTEWEHYPTNDARDPKSHAQYFLHAHAPDSRDSPDYAHFHTFMRSEGMPHGIRPYSVGAATALSAEAGDVMAHLIAISMTPAGMPERLFTTNRWVTAETWYVAPDVISMLEGFSFDGDEPSRILNRWLTAMLVLFRPQIEHLLIERDRVVERWRSRHPESDVFEDRRLEVPSSLEISLDQQISWLDGKLE